ncbi:dynein axonemal intermediate chain 4-like [Halyomorpha halys]|uniref:dynein axonemal intermediate chain 4-like n=1 Tax=Halyomorpha halys TaxID=286706 RepID=UPI0034D2937D
MDEFLEHSFDEFPNRLKFEEELRKEVERGKRKLDRALNRASGIPLPSAVPKKSEKVRNQEIKTVLEKHELAKAEAEKGDCFHVRLFETPTIFLFEITPTYFITGTEETENVQRLNERYKERKVSTDNVRYRDGFTQVVPTHFYKELLLTDPVEKKDFGCSASTWLLHDAYNEDQTKKDEGSTTERVATCEEEKEDEEETKSLIRKFQQAAMITCRVLSSNSFESQQISFSKKHQPSRGISYKMDLLWTLPGADLGPVNTICFNNHNSKIIGVGYGAREGPGTVRIWHVKNPEAAERSVATARAVTCLQFSRTQPRLLAATTRDGSVLLIDITNHTPIVTTVNEKELSPYPEPLWSLAWSMYDDGTTLEERLFTVGQTGLLWLWDPIKQTEGREMAKLSFVAAPDPELNVRFQDLLEEPLDSEDDDTIDPDQYFLEVPYIGLCISIGERNKVYVTTDMGCILCVNTHRADGRWEKIDRHKLAVLGMAHSPFIKSVYLSHSAGGDVCIWLHGMQHSILNLRVSDLSLYSIDSAAWSPSHSTILASCSRERVCIWDLSRKTDRPMASLTGRHYTRVSFSDAGTNLLVGCNDGDVLVYRLSEMPHRPHLQNDHLMKSLRKAVETKAELLKELDKWLRDH